MIRVVIQTEPVPPTHNVRDLYVIPYGSARWTVRYRAGLCLKLYKSLEDAVEAAWNHARKHGSGVYLQDVKGKRIKLPAP